MKKKTIREILEELYWHAHETGVQKTMPNNEIAVARAEADFKALIDEGEIMKGKGFYGFYSVSEFAEESKVTSQAIRKAIKEKRIKAFKIGKQWAIEKKELRKYLYGE